MQLGKLPGQKLAATGVPGPPPHSRLFYVSDTPTHTRFLVHTDSEVSAIPPTPADHRHSPDDLTLLAVNDSPIRTYGKRSLTLDLGLRRSLPWIFIIADVQKPILGADFLRHFGLLVDMQRRQLIDSHTHLHIQGILSSDPSPSPSICPRMLPTSTSPSCRSSPPSLKSAHQTNPSSTMSPTTLKPQDHQSPPVPDASHRTVSMLPSTNSNTCSSLASSDPPPVPGPRPFTWCPRRLPGIDGPVVTTVPSTVPLSLIATRCLTFMISPHYKAPPFSLKLTWFVHTTRFQSLLQMSTRPL